MTNLQIALDSFDNKVYLQDEDLYYLLVLGTTVPLITTAGYQKGCLFIDTDVIAWTWGLYCNKWTTASCNFTLVTQA